MSNDIGATVGWTFGLVMMLAFTIWFVGTVIAFIVFLIMNAIHTRSFGFKINKTEYVNEIGWMYVAALIWPITFGMYIAEIKEDRRR